MKAGDTLGPFRIIDKLGEGGMGEVYRATDANLKRQVAIKVLPEAVATDADRLARFQREAEVLASLNHPNIAAIHGLERSGGQTALVMELVEGPTLADRIARGPIPVSEALPIAAQIAEALGAAHDQGVVHRDLKPANVKLRPDGTVKVLDFGLAKAFDERPGEPDGLTHSPTLSMAATQAGIILGTAAYMSPEQAKGRRVDRRTDIWAFGSVLYEMLAGRPAFAGEDVTTVLARVVDREPDFTSLPAGLPRRLTEVLERCLQKDAGRRYHDIADVRLDLERVLSGPAEADVRPAADAERVSPRVRLPWVAAIVLTGVLGATITWLVRPTPRALPVAFEHAIGDGRSVTGLGLAVSPDGRRIAYSTADGVWVLSVDGFDAVRLSSVGAGAEPLDFSPDGQWLAYEDDGQGQLRKVPVGGGPSVLIAEVPTGLISGGAWGADNRIVFSTRAPGALMAVSGDGGTPVSLGSGVEAIGTVLLPQVLPDGESVLFTLATSPQVGDIAVYAPGMSEPLILFPGSNARYVPTGHILYWDDGAVYARRFDPDTLELEGGAVPVFEGVGSGVLLRISDSGTAVWAMASGPGGRRQRTLVWVDRNGVEEDVGAEARGYEYLRISHAGDRVAVDEANTIGDIRVWNFDTENAVRLTTAEESEQYPVWSHDDSRIAFGTTGQRDSVFWKASNNTGAIETLAADLQGGTQGVTPYFFTPDDRALVFRQQAHPDTRDNIGMIALDGDAEPVWLLDTEFDERNAELSPDGRWMAYQSSESGRFEVYVRPFPDVDTGLWTISTAGGVKPLWNPDGRELFYLQDGQPRQLMVVQVDPSGPTFAHQRPQALIPWPYDLGNEGRSYDVSRDGRRFLTTKAVESETGGPVETPRLRIVLNGLAGLD